MIAILIKASLVIIILLAFYKTFLEKESFFAANRFYLLSCLIFACVLPFIVLPKLVEHQGLIDAMIVSRTNTEIETVSNDIITAEDEIISDQYDFGPIEKSDEKIETIDDENIVAASPNEHQEIAEVQSAIIEKSTNSKEGKSLSFWLMMIYFFGVAVLSFNLIAQIISTLWKVFKNEDQIEDEDGIIVNMKENIEPCSFFNYIFINPASYDYDTYEQIIAHEKIHVNKKHTIDLLLSEVAVIILWFNPFSWILRKEVEKNLEYQTDDILINGEPSEKEGYQLNLVKIASYTKPLTITTNYNQSLIKQRILKMNTKKSNNYSYWKYAFVAPLLFVTLLLLNRPNEVFANDTITASDFKDAFDESYPELYLDLESNNELSEKENRSTSEKIENKEENQIDFIKKNNPINITFKACEDLEKAALNKDYNKVRSMINQSNLSCLDEKNGSSTVQELAKGMIANGAKININKEGTIRIYGTAEIITWDGEESNDGEYPECDELKKATEAVNIQRIRKILLGMGPSCFIDDDGSVNNFSYIKKLLKAGANVKVGDNDEITIYGVEIFIDFSDDLVNHYDNNEHEHHNIHQHQLDGQENDYNLGDYGNEDCSLLNKAARKGDIAKVKKLLESTDCNCIDPNPGYEIKELKNGMTMKSLYPRIPLVSAAREGHSELAKVLLGAGAKINFYPRDNESPLMAAAGNGYLELTKYFLKKGANLNDLNDGYGSALHASARNGHLETVKYLLNQGADIDAQNDGQGTPLNGAARNNHIKLAEFLLSKGADINLQNDGQGSALNAAARNGHNDMVRLLLSKGADIDAQRDGQGSALNAAARNGHNSTVELLLSKGANINRQNDGQGSALNAAARNGHLKTVKLLIEKGADVNLRSDGQGTALTAAGRNGHTGVMDYLVSKGADIHSGTPNQGTALINAAQNGNLKTTEYLLENGAEIDKISSNQGTALIAAASNGQMETVEYLLSKGAAIDKISSNQGSALIAAASNGHKRTVDFLLSKSADINLMSSNHGTALIAAAGNGHLNTVKLLIEKGAEINKVSSNHGTALIYAAQNGHTDVIKFLESKGGKAY